MDENLTTEQAVITEGAPVETIDVPEVDEFLAEPGVTEANNRFLAAAEATEKAGFAEGTEAPVATIDASSHAEMGFFESSFVEGEAPEITDSLAEDSTPE